MFAIVRGPSSILTLVTVISVLQIVVAQSDPGIPCKETKDCTSFSPALKNASCTDGYCICDDKNCTSSLPRANTPIVVFTDLRTCTVPQDCKFENSFCNTTTRRCECEQQHIWSDLKKACLKKAHSIGSPCVEDMQCLAYRLNTQCKDKRCSCLTGYHVANKRCYRTVDIGEPCMSSEECSIVDDAICTDRGMCDCPEGTVLYKGGMTCLPVADDFTDSCIVDAQCSNTFLENAICVNGRCRCRRRYHFEQEMNRCFVTRGLDDNCGNSYECYQANETVKKLHCKNNVCVCRQDYHRDGEDCIEGTNEAARWMGSFLTIMLAVMACFHGI